MLRIIATSLVCVSVLAAQQADRVQGHVADQTGARIPGATVSLRAISTNWKASTPTAADGTFRFPAPPAGRLELRVEQPGFQTHTRTLDLEPQGSAEIAVTLSAGS